MICTSIEQSKHLLELGLSPKTADCKWVEKDDGRSRWFDLEVGKPVTAYEIKHCPPAWSLSALLEVLRQANAVTTLQVTSLSTLMRCKDMGFIWQNDLHIYDPTTAAYEMVCWLLEQGLIKKGDNDE